MRNKVAIYHYANWNDIAKYPDNISISVIVKGILGKDERISEKACLALRNRKKISDAKPFVRKLLHARQPDIRLMTITLLPSISEVLARKYCPNLALKDSDRYVCAEAFNITLRLLSPESQPSFLRKAMNSKRTEVRLVAAQNLSSLIYCSNHDIFIKTAESMMKDKDSSVREATVNAIGYYPEQGTLPLLSNALYDPVDAVRKQVVISLSGSKWDNIHNICPILAVALNDRQLEIRFLAAEALVRREYEPTSYDQEQEVIFQIVRNQYDDLLKHGPTTARLICAIRKFTPEREAALISIGEPSIEYLLELLVDQDWGVRRDSARILSSIHGKLDTAHLKDLVALEEKEEVKFWLRKAIESST